MSDNNNNNNATTTITATTLTASTQPQSPSSPQTTATTHTNNNKHKATKFEAFKQALWNPRTKTCLGRTKSSWAKLIAFYIVLYTCLAAIWTLFFYIFRLTISEKSPKWTLSESLIGVNPGLGFRPRGIEEDSALIKIDFNESEQKFRHDIDKYVKNVDDFVKSTESGEYEGNCRVTDDKFCPINRNVIAEECTAAKNYSFDTGMPCILVKLNRIYGWIPDPYINQPKDFPTENAPSFISNFTQITCGGLNNEDKENVISVEHFGKNYIESLHFPYMNQRGYQSPYVMIRFNVKRDRLIRIECRAWAKNIRYDRTNQEGSINFELYVSSNKKTIA